MNVVFRTDASNVIGSGHVMRCLTLADALCSEGAAGVEFVCRDFPGHLANVIEQRGYPVRLLPPPDGPADSWLGVSQQRDAAETTQSLAMTPDWLIVDHYAIDSQWESLLRPHCRRLMVIDDLADRPHDCDVLLDHNWLPDMAQRYQAMVPSAACCLLGPEYLLLPESIWQAAAKAVPRDGQVRRLLLFMGGADPLNLTAVALDALRGFVRRDWQIDVVVGQSNPQRQRIADMCAADKRCDFHCQTPSMLQLICQADLAIGAGGVSAWERCMLGLPTLAVCAAGNQRAGLQMLAAHDCVELLGEAEDVSAERIAVRLQWLLDHPERLVQLSGNGIAALAGARPVSGPRKVAGVLLG